MPVRTCLVCRQAGDQETLWRVSVVRSQKEGVEKIDVVPDMTKSRLGRGLYFHFPACFSNKAFLKCLNGALSTLYKKWEKEGTVFEEKVFVTSQAEFLKAAQCGAAGVEKSERLALLQKTASENSPKFKQVLTPMRRANKV